MSKCFTWFPISGLGKPKLYQNLGYFTRNGDFTWRVSDCEELVGVIHREMIGLFLCDYLLKLSIYPLTQGFPVFVVFCSDPRTPTFPFPHISVSYTHLRAHET